jgi:hypothetical protein
VLAISLCALGFVISYGLARRSIGHGLGAAFIGGYFYGILRVNITEAAAQLVFDVSLVGVYLACFQQSLSQDLQNKTSTLRAWCIFLVGWPLVLTVAPFGHLIIQLVGLRNAAFFVPMLLVATRFTQGEFCTFGRWLAVLNLVALTFAFMEYVLGVEAFFPRNPLSEIIYRSTAGEGSLRIPATFANAHCFGGAMVCSLPFLFGAYLYNPSSKWSPILIAGFVAACMGILLSSTRSNIVYAVGSLAVLFVRHRGLLAQRAIVGLLVITVPAIAYFLSVGDARIHRYEMIQVADFMEGGRVGNISYIIEIVDFTTDCALKNPLGAGLASGVSIPNFLLEYLPPRFDQPVIKESEFARIAITQGVVGVLAWFGFLIWLFGANRAPGTKQTKSTYSFMYFLTLMIVASGIWCVGVLAAVPMAAMVYLMMGFIAMGGPHPDRIIPGRTKQRTKTRTDKAPAVLSRSPQGLQPSRS